LITDALPNKELDAAKDMGLVGEDAVEGELSLLGRSHRVRLATGSRLPSSRRV
jgi:hypothetical protein